MESHGSALRIRSYARFAPSGLSITKLNHMHRYRHHVLYDFKDHFESHAFEQVREDGKLKLRRDAVPTLFPHRPPVRRQKPPARQPLTWISRSEKELSANSECTDYSYAKKSTGEIAMSESYQHVEDHPNPVTG